MLNRKFSVSCSVACAGLILSACINNLPDYSRRNLAAERRAIPVERSSDIISSKVLEAALNDAARELKREEAGIAGMAPAGIAPKEVTRFAMTDMPEPGLPVIEKIPDPEIAPPKPSRAPGSTKATQVSAECRRWEPTGAIVSGDGAGEVQAVAEIFYAAKGALVIWLEQNASRLGQERVAAMKAQLLETDVVTAGGDASSDLAWRGAAVLVRAHDGGKSEVRFGRGFAQLAKKQPEFARFEASRVLAQVWDSCAGGPAWDGFLKCMNLEDANARGCAPGAYSEAGWAISTAIAAQASNPGCRIPALDGDRERRCVSKHLLPEKTHGGDSA